MRSPGDAPPILPPLKAIQAFEQTARFGSVARAAEVLDLTPSAVSHQLAKLEAMIGRQLFLRTARGVTLTPVGEQYLTEVSGICIAWRWRPSAPPAMSALIVCGCIPRQVLACCG
jgi:hypothetical protein